MDTMKQPERDNRIKKYGGWAMNISDTEAEEIFQNYSAGMPLLKQIVEKAFGKNHTYYVESDCFATGEGIHLDVYPELGEHFCGMDIAVELGDNSRMMVTAHFSEYLNSIKSFDCGIDELLGEIENESNDWDDGEDEPWSLSWDGWGDLPGDAGGDGDVELTFFLNIHGGDGIWSLPTVDELNEYFERVKEIIDSHKKKTAKKGS